MATSDEYIFKVKCSVDDEIDGIKSLFANAQATADKNAIKVRVTGDEKELAKELEKLKKLNPSVLTKIILDVDDGNLKETSDFLSKVIGRQLRQSSDISKAFKDQITSGIDENQIRELLSSTLKSAFGDSTKVTSGNISALYGKLKEEANELNATMLRGMDTDKAFSRITELAKKLEILQAAFKNQDAAGLTKTLKPTNLGFDAEELKSTIGSFYKEIGDYIGSDTQKLNDDIVAAYTKVKDTLLQNVVQIFSNGGKTILEALSIAGAQEQIARNTAEIEEIQNTTIKKVQEARKNIENAAKAGYSERKSDANNLVRNFEIIKQSGLPDFDFSTLTKEQQKNINLMLSNAEGADKIIESVTADYEKIRIQRENLLKMNEGLSHYVTTQNGEIGTQVASQLSTLKSANISGNSVGVEIEPVISDPAAFIAKIEEQLVNQAVKVIIEPTIESVAKFEQLLQQQLPNEFINIQLKLDEKSTEVPITPTISDPAAFAQKVNEIIAGYPAGINIDPIVQDIVAFQEDIKKQVGIIPISVSPTVDSAAKENLKETTALDFSGILTDLDNLKSKVIDFKKEIDTLQESAKNALTTTSSLFEQFSAQPTSDSGKITSVIESLKELSGTVNQDIDVEKTGHFVQALNEIGKLQVNPNIDLSNFKLGKLNSYLEKSEQLVHLGAALESLAAGLGSLNISLTGANFEALKGVSISDKTIENLPKFAAGITQLKDELDKFSSSATGVLSSISQIVSKAQSLEYLYKLSTAPNSNVHSNIIGNGLMSAFDKSAINSIQHPAGNTDEVVALAKEYQWLTSQARTYFELSSKFAKGTINSNDAAKLMQLQRAMEGATQRMNQFQETDQSLITAQNDLSTALSRNGTAIETALVNNLNKAIDKIDETQAEALGFKDALDAVKAKVTDIQNAFSSDGLISSKEIENAEAVLKKALEDAKQLKADISSAQKKRGAEIKNSYKNILGNYSQSALSKAGVNQPENSVKVQKLANEYDYLTQMVGKYIQLLKEDASSKSVNSERISKIQALTQAYEAFISRQKAGVDTDALLQNSVSNLNTSLSGMAKTLSGELTATLGSYIAKITDIKNGTTKYAASIEKMKQAQAAINSQLGDNTADFAALKNALDTYASGLNAYKSVLADVAASERDATEAEKQALTLDIQKWMNKNTKAAAKYKEELAALLDQLTKVTDRSGLEAVQTSYLKLQNRAEKLKETGSAFGDVMKAKFKELSTYLMSFASFYQVVNILKQGISIAHEYDDAFTEMRKVTDSSTSSLKEFQKESFQLANQVGTTAEQLQQSTADWLRLGESFDEAKKSAQVSNVLLNVSEFENIDSATESLVAMSQAYQDLDKMGIVDKLNNVGNKFNITTNALAESLQRSAATLKTTGNDINEAIALTVAGNSILQDPLSVGAGLKTISLRIQGTEAAKQELEELGEETENVIHTTAKLQETIKECTAVASNGFKGVDILDNNGNFLSTYEILSRIAEVYQEIVETDKQAGTNRSALLVETLAGKNRANIAASILQSPDLLKKVYAEVQNSAGSAEKELNSYLESISGKMEKLQNAWQELWFNFIDSDTVKGVVDVLTSLANILEKITTFAKPLGTISALAGGILSAFGRGKLIKLYNAFFYKVA